MGKKCHRPIGPRTREHAANLCSSRACAEADPDFHIGGSTNATASQHVWTPRNWTAREGQIAYRAFCIAVNRNGVGRGMAEVNWGEAEAMIRCKEIDS
jgi:hypothetical protein